MQNNNAEQQELGKQYNLISPTAWTVAFRRAFTDIPYSTDIFNELEKMRSEDEIQIPEELKTPAIACQFEARYKLVNRLLGLSGISQVLEIASGFSPRGLQLTDDPKIVYVEIDLPLIMAQKRKIVDAISSKKRENLHLIDGDATSISSLKKATIYFDPEKPIAVINEGLLRYLNFDEKTIVARNVNTLLKQFGGAWITPDITLPHVLNHENQVAKNQTKLVEKLTGIDINNNRFRDIEHAKTFFENLGFSIEDHSFMEVIDNLVSPIRLSQTRKEVESLIGDAHVFLMVLRT